MHHSGNIRDCTFQYFLHRCLPDNVVDFATAEIKRPGEHIRIVLGQGWKLVHPDFSFRLDRRLSELYLEEETALEGRVEVEAAVHDAVEKCFLNGTKGLNSNDILEIAKRTVSITKFCKKQIDAMQKVFSESSFRDATTGKITNAKSAN